MKSVFLETGADESAAKFVLKDNVDVPVPEKNDVLIQVKACALSTLNLKVLNEVFKKSPKKHYPVGHGVAGVVTKVGSNVTSVKVGQEVVGVVSSDSHYSGCAEYTVFQEHDVVRKPDMVSFEDAAGLLGDAVRAYTALHYCARVCGGDTLLIVDGATSFGTVCIQLAQHWGAKVLATSSTQEETAFLSNFQPPIAHVVDLGHKSNMMVSSVMEETGGLGVDCVIDNGDGVTSRILDLQPSSRLFNTEEDITSMAERYKYPVPHKNDVISCLGVGSRWVTSQMSLQLDPPNSQQLFLRGASLCFLFDQIWMLSQAQHGRYQHILHDAAEKIDRGIIKVKIAQTVTLDNAVQVLQKLNDVRIGKVVVKI